MANDNTLSNLPAWKLWGAALAGAIMAYLVGSLSGIGSDQTMFDAGQKFGYSLPWGAIIGFLMWAIFYFPVFKNAAMSKRILTYLIVLLGGALGVMSNI